MTRDRGFSLVEMLIALAVFLVAAAFTAQLLAEAAQQLTDAAAEQPLPLVRARLRSDILASQAAACVRRLDGTLREVRLLRHPEGTVIYRVESEALFRSVDGGTAEAPVLRGVEQWTCGVGGGLIRLDLTVRRRAVRRTPLAVAPEARGPLTETRTETLLLAPRGAGLGEGW
jgi:prepilin-type N-terminal cleavage/methylation domain-containing protein